MADAADEIRAVATEFTDTVFNRHDVDAAAEYFSPDFVEHDPWPNMPPTVEGFKDGTRQFLEAFPDTRCEVDDVICEGDKVVVRSRLVGTNSGTFMGMPPTGRRVEVAGIDIVRVANGRMTEHWGLYDAAGLMAQLGVGAPRG